MCEGEVFHGGNSFLEIGAVDEDVDVAKADRLMLAFSFGFSFLLGLFFFFGIFCSFLSCV